MPTTVPACPAPPMKYKGLSDPGEKGRRWGNRPNRGGDPSLSKNQSLGGKQGVGSLDVSSLRENFQQLRGKKKVS